MMPFLDPVTHRRRATERWRSCRCSTELRTHLRHHAARRRAVAGRDDDVGREARGRARARAARRRRHRGGLPRGVARRSRGGARHRRARSARAGRGRPSREPPIICGARRARRARDIDRAWEARAAPRARPRIHTFLATSRASHEAQAAHDAARGARARRARWSRYARSSVRRRRVQPRGRRAQRSGVPLRGRSRRAIARRRDDAQHPRHGRLHDARRVRRAHRRHPRERARRRRASILSVHCHDDLGLATANTLAGLRAGARQAEVTINGIGERAGNSVARGGRDGAAHARARSFGLRTGIDTTQLVRTSAGWSATCTGIAGAAEQGRSSAPTRSRTSRASTRTGCSSTQATYEIMQPGDGRRDADAARPRQALGAPRLRGAPGELGYALDEAALDRVFARFKALADRRKSVTDADLEALVADRAAGRATSASRSRGCRSAAARMGMPTATVRLRGPDGAAHVQAAVGTGPVDAAYQGDRRRSSARRRAVEFACTR